MNLDLLTTQDITSKLAGQPARDVNIPFPSELVDGPSQPAAVLILLLHYENEWHTLLIRRTEVEEDRHSGQVAFPGGMCDSDDGTAEEAALREAEEELGVNPKDVQVLGKLNDFLTITSFQVTPVIGTIPWPYPIKPSPEEVSKVFTIPLSWLNDPDNREILERELPNNTKISVIYFKKYENEILWGASARIMLELLNALQ